MGYTHYWHYTPSKIKGWAAKIEDCNTIVAATLRQFELDVDATTADQLGFNGPDDERDLCHETFIVPRTIDDMRSVIKERKQEFSGFCKGADLDRQSRFQFCKTAQKPYDVVVVACLCVLAESGLQVSSDGSRSEWEPGRALAQELLGRPIVNPIQEEEPT